MMIVIACHYMIVCYVVVATANIIITMAVAVFVITAAAAAAGYNINHAIIIAITTFVAINIIIITLILLVYIGHLREEMLWESLSAEFILATKFGLCPAERLLREPTKKVVSQ